MDKIEIITNIILINDNLKKKLNIFAQKPRPERQLSEWIRKQVNYSGILLKWYSRTAWQTEDCGRYRWIMENARGIILTKHTQAQQIGMYLLLGINFIIIGHVCSFEMFIFSVISLHQLPYIFWSNENITLLFYKL